MSSAPPAQKDHLVPGEFVFSDSIIYLVESILGEGTFGKVAKCKRMNDLTTVAIKSIKEDHLIWLARKEVAALSKLKKLDQDKCNIVRWYRAFSDRGHFCLEFELLDKSLFDFMQQRSFCPLFVREIRPIVQQLANALKHLKAVGIIHADLKLENVMLVNHGQEPYRVKLIDFGLACEVSAAAPGSYIQTRVYRSPEIMLAVPFTEAIDMWSLGCLAAELYLGTLLYPGINEYDMMRHIVATQGLPPDSMLNAGRKTSCFFEREFNSWKLKTPEKYYREMGTQLRESRKLRFSSLDNLMHVRPVNHYNHADKVVKTADQLMFVDLLKKMLQLDAAQRIAPCQVLEHDFITCHIAKTYPRSFYVQACFETMNVCQTSGKAVHGALQQPSSRTMHPIQQSRPPPPLPPPADMTRLIQSNCINPQACTRLHTATSVKSGKRRKTDHEDGNLSCHVLRRTKSSMHSFAGPSTSSASQDPSDRIQASTTARSHPAWLPCRRSTNETCNPQRVKRKMATDEEYSFHERSGHEVKRVRKNSKAQGTCSNSSSNAHHSRPDGRSPPVHHHHKVYRSISTQTESLDWAGVTNKAAEGDDGWHRMRPTDPRKDNNRKERRPREPHITEEDTPAAPQM